MATKADKLLLAGSSKNTRTFFILAFDLSLDNSHVFHILFCNSILTVESFTADLKSVAFHSLKKVTRQYAYQIQVSLVGAVWATYAMKRQEKKSKEKKRKGKKKERKKEKNWRKRGQKRTGKKEKKKRKRKKKKIKRGEKARKNER